MRPSANLGFPWPGEQSVAVHSAIGTGLPEQFVAQCECGAVLRRDLHQAASHVHGVTRRGDVLKTSTAQSGRNDCPEMRADLESNP